MLWSKLLPFGPYWTFHNYFCKVWLLLRNIFKPLNVLLWVWSSPACSQTTFFLLHHYLSGDELKTTDAREGKSQLMMKMMLEGGYMLLLSPKEKTKRSGFGQARVAILIWNWNVYTLQSLNDCFELNQFFIVCERFRLWWRWDSLGWLSSMPWRQVTMMSMWPQIFYCHSLSLDQVLLVVVHYSI